VLAIANAFAIGYPTTKTLALMGEWQLGDVWKSKLLFIC